jgi:hypothetical protein
MGQDIILRNQLPPKIGTECQFESFREQAKETKIHGSEIMRQGQKSFQQKETPKAFASTVKIAKYWLLIANLWLRYRSAGVPALGRSGLCDHLLKILGRSAWACGDSILFLAGFEPATATKIKMQIARSDDVRSRRFFPIRPAPPKPCAQAGDLWTPATGRWGMRRT